MSDPLERMRRGNPVRAAEPPSIEPVFARIAAIDALPPASRRTRQRRLHRPAVLGLVVLLLAAAVAVAASGVLVGDPVTSRGVTFTPSKGLGVPTKGSVKLFALRVPDPDGGPEWGLRLLSTTRGLGCLQLGRVVDDRLGVLGRDGVFADDGKFHELPPTVLDQANCTLLDAKGQTFLAVADDGLAASSMQGGCTATRQPARPPGIPGPVSPKLPVCAPASLRIVYYGTLGPQARSVTYDAPDGSRRRAPVEGPEGAYLVVSRPAPGSRPDGHWTSLFAPGSGLKSVSYADGHVCHIRSPRVLGGAKPCPPVGYVAPRRPRVTSAQVAAPIHVRLHGDDHGQRRLDISFRARVAVRSGHSSYQLLATYPRSKGCHTGGMAGPAFENVAVGATVRMTMLVVSNCPGVLRGQVVFSYNDPLSPVPLFSAGLTKGRPTVGRFSVRIPPR